MLPTGVQVQSLGHGTRSHMLQLRYLSGRFFPRTQRTEVPFTICDHLNQESLCGGVGGGMYWGGNNDLKRWPLVLRIHHNEHSVFKGELAFPQKAFRQSHILGSESKNSRKSSTFPHWRSYTEKSTRGSRGNEKTQLVIPSTASNLHFCDPSILGSSIHRLFSFPEVGKGLSRQDAFRVLCSTCSQAILL